MGLIDDIKREKKGIATTMESTESLIVEQKLNKLFFLDKDDLEETKFILMLMQKNGQNKERFGLHASAIIVSENDFCYRQQVLSLFYKMSQGEHISPGLKRIFEEGNAIHEKWQRLMIRGKLGKADNMDVSKFASEYDLSYTPDGSSIQIGKHKYIVEIKSVNTFQFKKMTSHPSGKKQCQLYMHLEGIHKGIVLCEDKNTQDIKVFLYDYEPEIVAPYIERLETIQFYKKDLIKNKKMIKGICKDSSCKRARDCNMQEACFGIGMGRIKLENKLK